jgi:O-antigen/teichoic acid export membrane protein
MLSARRVAYNTVIQVLGRGLGLVITLVTINYIATHLIVDGSALVGYGQYTIVFTYVSIIGTAADLGLFTLLVRELVGKNEEEAGQLIGNALWFRASLFLLFLILSFLAVQFLPYDAVVKEGILIGIVIAFSMLFSQVLASVFQARLVTHNIVIAETLGKLAIAALTIYVLKQGLGLAAVVWANLGGQLLTLGVSYLLARPFLNIRLRPDFAVWRRLLPQFWPIALISVMSLAHFKVDVLLLSVMKSEVEVGIYGLAYKILEVVIIIPSVLSANLLPVMADSISAGASVLASVIRRTVVVSAMIVLPIAVFIYLFAPEAVTFLATGEFIDAALPLRILTLAMVFIFFTTVLLQSMIAARASKRLIVWYFIALSLNTLVNLAVIPRYSYLGAAVTTVCTELLLLAGIVFSAHRNLGSRLPWGALIRLTLTGAAVLLLGSWFLGALDLTFVGQSKLALLVYLVLGFAAVTGLFFLMLRLFARQDLAALKAPSNPDGPA